MTEKDEEDDIYQEDPSNPEDDEFTGLDPNSFIRVSLFASYAREHRLEFNSLR
jgi:hypothetical protein